MRNTVPNYVFRQRYENFILIEDAGPSTHVLEEFLRCHSPVEAIFYDEVDDPSPCLTLNFDSPKDVQLARSHPETWERMGPTGYLYSETPQWGVYASLVGEITVIGYNSVCEAHVNFVKKEYGDIIWTIEEAAETLRPSPYRSEKERELFKRLMRLNYPEST